MAIGKSDYMKKICSRIETEKFPVNVIGLQKSQKVHFATFLKQKFDCQSIFITYSQSQAKKIYDDMKFFFRDVYYYPSKKFASYVADVKSVDVCSKRLDALEALSNNKKCAVVLSAESLFDRLSEPNFFRDSVINLSVGDIFSIEVLSERLIFLGYQRANIVESAGQFSVHGGILDLCSNKYAVRIEFFDNEIDSIRFFDLETQRSQVKTNFIQITPMCELIFSKEKLQQLSEKLAQEGKVVDIKNVDMYADFFCDVQTGLFDYFSEDALIFFDEPAKIIEGAKNFYEDFQLSVREQIKLGNMFENQSNIILNLDTVISKIRRCRAITFETFRQNCVLSVDDFFEIKAREPQSIKIYSEQFLLQLKEWLDAKKMVVVLLSHERFIRRFVNYLADKNIPVKVLRHDDEVCFDKIYIACGQIHSSFEYVDENFIVVAEHFKNNLVTSDRKKKNQDVIRNFLDLKINDRIVHDKHGVGIYKGIEKIVVDGCTKDYLRLEYADAGVLFVNTSQMDLVHKYIGSENVRINKLGGSEWQKNKLRVRNEVKKIAQHLINLYAKRKDAKGFTFSKDNIWQTEFENTFPYDETNDQLSAVNDIKKDMESDAVMDRLICGDVGYGKTEVAMRAAFKAVQDSKQVAYLVPTTILAQQHFNTFLKRFADFPVNIEMLSRFRSQTQQKKIIDKLASGQIDIVIGTHKLLSDNIKFKDLGLVIVDEEQRFGVTHKEKLKQLCANVDALTLSATPIPRTLNMSLSGIRDISLLTEPPHERQPVQTYVLEYNKQIIKKAIEDELARKGQVYYLYNQVKNIMNIASQIKKLVPDANVKFAHGQLSELELENIMEKFVEGQIDVLVCTTIIETGMDIQNVNTIIIHDADKMGLSQLYQLRGRVGRSNKLAYAYLTYKKDKILTQEAEQRLKTIKEFTEFGAGFKIAMKDLEIRGAGNLLGAEQHGNIDAVGYDLYCKLLNEEINKLKSGQDNNEAEQEFETSIELNLNGYIPQEYINDEIQKLDMYKKISFINGKEDYEQLQDELIDRYGDIPNSVQNLLDIALIKSFAQKLCMSSIVQKGKDLIINVDGQSSLSADKLFKIINTDKDLFFSTSPSPVITYKNFLPQKIKNLKEILFELC